jgi:hypothetical protein
MSRDFCKNASLNIEADLRRTPPKSDEAITANPEGARKRPTGIGRVSFVYRGAEFRFAGLPLVFAQDGDAMGLDQSVKRSFAQLAKPRQLSVAAFDSYVLGLPDSVQHCGDALRAHYREEPGPSMAEDHEAE